MRWSCIATIVSCSLAGAAILFSPALARGQEAASENLVIGADTATTWVDPQSPATNIVALEGKVRIELDHNVLTADRAVLWLTPVKGKVLQEIEAQIALLGNAAIDQAGQATQSGDRLLVTASLRGVVRITANQRRVGNQESGELYQAALPLRPLPPTAQPPEVDHWLLQPAAPSATQPTTKPVKRRQPVAFSADKIETVHTDEGKLAVVVTGNVKLFQRRGDVEIMELQADRAVLFTPLRDLRDLEKGGEFEKIEDAITAAYLEGDVRIVHTPPNKKLPDQRLLANRAYYDFETDRAVMTDAVIHTIEPQRSIPIIVRAKMVRQLSMGEYKGEKVKLTQSSFHTPSYHIGMREAYIRQEDTGDPRTGTRTYFVGRDATFNASGTPLFYMPYMSGSFTERGGPLRNLQLNSSSRFGTGIKTDWGIFETLGKLPPKDVDAQLSLDYFLERGPAIGLDGRYAGGFVTEQGRQPWAFDGKLESYLINDHGVDELSRKRLDVEPEQSLRYRLAWEHQHFFPGNWQLQVSTALISDPTFQEEWFRNQFESQRPLDTALYVKHQAQNEAFTLLYSIQPNDFVTAATLYQEQAEVEKVPEVSYHRIGQSIGESGLTLFSDNAVGGYRFQRSSAPFFAPEGDKGGLGFRAVDSPGLPSFGQTGMTSDVVWRGDFRQELDYPFNVGQFRVVPYVLGRYTIYSDSPDSSQKDRLLLGAGARVTTAFWKVDDTVKSEIFDLHRLRHVIEPELNVFTSATSTERSELFHYDEEVDQINDLTVIQLALHQRWQTKRGGPGRWRSVDFLTLNVEGNFFLNKPPDRELSPVGFRGLYFPSMPEASIPRNSINGDLTWRLSDTTAILADVQYNLDEQNLSTASIGLAVSRDERLAYFFGVRYLDSGDYLRPNAGGSTTLEKLHSVVVTGAVSYELTPKYTLALRQSFDFGERERVLSYYSLIRHFDRWYASITYRVDYLSDDSGFFINVWPEGMTQGAGPMAGERLQNAFR